MPTDRILLYGYKNDDISVTIEAYFDQDQNLVIEGYDIGKSVEEYWGDSDYEYSSTIAPMDMAKVYVALEIEIGNKEELLLALQRRFNTNSCYSEIQKFLTDHAIAFTTFSWN